MLCSNQVTHDASTTVVHYGPAGASQLAVIGAFVRYGDFTSPFLKDIKVS